MVSMSNLSVHQNVSTFTYFETYFNTIFHLGYALEPPGPILFSPKQNSPISTKPDRDKNICNSSATKYVLAEIYRIYIEKQIIFGTLVKHVIFTSLVKKLSLNIFSKKIMILNNVSKI